MQTCHIRRRAEADWPSFRSDFAGGPSTIADKLAVNLETAVISVNFQTDICSLRATQPLDLASDSYGTGKRGAVTLPVGFWKNEAFRTLEDNPSLQGSQSDSPN